MDSPSSAPSALYVLPAVFRIPLRARDGTVRAWATVDLADAPLVAGHRWCQHTHGYAVRAIGGRKAKYMLRMHRLLVGLSRDDAREVDHKDRNPLNNRRSNLRIATHAQNQQNMPGRVNATSRHRGVCFNARRGKWEAWGKVDGRSKLLGRFDREDDAHVTRLAWQREYMPFAME